MKSHMESLLYPYNIRYVKQAIWYGPYDMGHMIWVKFNEWDIPALFVPNVSKSVNMSFGLVIFSAVRIGFDQLGCFLIRRNSRVLVSDSLCSNMLISDKSVLNHGSGTVCGLQVWHFIVARLPFISTMNSSLWFELSSTMGSNR